MASAAKIDDEDTLLHNKPQYDISDDSGDSDIELDELGDVGTDLLAGTRDEPSEQKHRGTDELDHIFARALAWRVRKRTLIVISVVAVLLVFGALFGWGKYTQNPPEGRSPPWYPTPKGGTVSQWAESYAKAAKMVGSMTLAEKVNITTGTGWAMGLAVGNTGPAIHAGFPALALQDGPLGIRFADNSTAFPAGITVGATWNKELMYLRGQAHGQEAREKGINVLLGPSVGPLGRMPAGGRNWEGFGPDPYLQGIAAAETIRGIQGEGVMATIKHFVANEQEHFRQPWAWGLPHAVSSNVDDRAMHELYAWPFANAVKAGVASVMCSYNMVNNSYACGNSKLLNGILKDELGFQGFVMSDWLAQQSGVASALAGLDMSMPGDGLGWTDGKSLWGPHLSRAVLNGSLPVSRLDDMTMRIVASWYQLGQDDKSRFDGNGPNFSSWTKHKMGFLSDGSSSPQERVEVNKYVNVQHNHSTLAKQVAVEGTVLLKNSGILPMAHSGLRSETTRKREGKTNIGIFGDDAGPGLGANFCDDRGCNEGTLGSGWGSGAVEFPYLVTPESALRKAFDSSAVNVSSWLSAKKPSKELLQAMEVCIVFANADGGEGYLKWTSVAGDRNDLFLQKEGDDFIIAVAEGCGGGKGKTIVVIHSVGPVVMERWIEHPGIEAVLYANLPGQESGNALLDIVFGHVSPSGKLPYTIGKSLDDYGPGGKIMYTPNGLVPQQDFTEGLYIDYRHFDKFNIKPRFEFGFGLSYTSFNYSNLQITEVKAKSKLAGDRPADEANPPDLGDKIPDVSEAMFPAEIRKLKKYIYPYIQSEAEIEPGEYTYPKGYDVKQPPSAAGGGEGGHPELWETHVTVRADVGNEGAVSGKTVLQLYVSFPDTKGVSFPVRVLRGFEKVLLALGESRSVEFNLTRRDLSYWDTTLQNWVMPEGQFSISVGASSRDLKLSGTW
ncbi:Glycoside hydrolase, family 3 [Cordyceps fumosorosea ARSEF 2679]|uniref:beta-glucosidase n=1 Tax=Cordyceps fumosorosea (strain ARSEF 2679) TaxID=1081104 RepID=A0A168BNF2_CORFA|nr:Glycoside hydrolase, family 3 [Cordyceps fumosorosea ARSEF 2679]OAA70341.1 Glycoside hydrolase, family 3 [Cordyceps fumosorosea ARSEF 2679]